MTVQDLPTLNAILNATATVLLVTGLVLIKRRRERAHKAVMLSAFCVSVVFLCSYLVYHTHLMYHTQAGHMEFTGGPPVSYLYFAILVSHVVLAAIVPFLAMLTIYWGLRDRRDKHRKMARWTFPIWLYVSITGVVIYLMLYVLYPAPA